LLEKRICSQADFDTIKQSVDTEMDEAVKFAQDSPEPDVSELLADVYTV
ncbi:MAG: pyruvate dehydrogenase (acetyl-transferring) E1 component subunit alpha, partial [Deltaproteobacteria bacterium]|nr:pyruvate dehydrogenase (acetyl-transferring) E1 component subunit alpha [Deltaproteobacteria bacterium]